MAFENYEDLIIESFARDVKSGKYEPKIKD